MIGGIEMNIDEAIIILQRKIEDVNDYFDFGIDDEYVAQNCLEEITAYEYSIRALKNEQKRLELIENGKISLELLKKNNCKENEMILSHQICALEECEVPDGD